MCRKFGALPAGALEALVETCVAVGMEEAWKDCVRADTKCAVQQILFWEGQEGHHLLCLDVVNKMVHKSKCTVSDTLRVSISGVLAPWCLAQLFNSADNVLQWVFLFGRSSDLSQASKIVGGPRPFNPRRLPEALARES
mgnify:FL=1